MGHFERIKYPDGQISAKWIPAKNDANPLMKVKNLISERINSYEDLFYVRAIAEVLRHQGLVKRFNLFIPCLFGQRSDRRFDDNQSFDLKIIADIINQCKFNEIHVLDPHSDVSLALINDVEKLSSFQYVEKVVADITTNKQLLEDGHMTDLILVSPDAGAYKKVFDYGEKLNMPVVAAVKHRDLDGKIDLTFMGDVKDKDCLIVDDLCDGGYTFELLSKALKASGARKIYLYVSHGLFSKGFKGMHEAGIDHIYCTNSIKDVNMRDIGRDEGLIDFITQYKVV